ncbi:MAG: hypothetical protein IAF08_15260, partial [Rhizobacter sp.]|nr:hypothetical protein [Chlorobiales bacterium]
MSQPAASADTPLIEKSPPAKTGIGRQAMRFIYFMLAFIAVDRVIYFGTIYFAGHVRGNRLIVSGAHNDLVVVGASHSKDAIYPNAFRDALGFETINLSISGLETSDYAALLERYLRHNPAPKTVLFDGTAWLYAQTASPESQEKNQSNRYRYFLPFTGIDADYERLVQPSLPPETLILGKVIATYTLNNQLDVIFNDGYRHHTLSRRSDGYLGQNILHDGLTAAQEKNWAYKFPNGYRLKASSKTDLENVIAICERYKTKIFFVNFPVDARLDRI